MHNNKILYTTAARKLRIKDILLPDKAEDTN